MIDYFDFVGLLDDALENFLVSLLVALLLVVTLVLVGDPYGCFIEQMNPTKYVLGSGNYK